MNLQENIARMEQELADIKKQLEQQDKLELKGGEGYTFNCYGDVKNTCLTDEAIGTIYGLLRADKNLAKLAGINCITRNRLEAYVHQIQGDGEGMYYIYKGKTEYKCSNLSEIDILGAVMMQKETAEILCEALNKGEIEL